MVRSKAEAPHFYVEMDVSTDALRDVRDQANRDAGDKRARLTYTHLMIKACALALEKFPSVNATFRAEENDIAMFDAINIGARGRRAGRAGRADREGLPGQVRLAARRGGELADPARAHAQARSPPTTRTARSRSRTSACSVSIASTRSSRRRRARSWPCPRSRERPVVRSGGSRSARMTTLGLSVDHRVLDGVRAAQFLAEIKRLLEAPRELVQDGHELRQLARSRSAAWAAFRTRRRSSCRKICARGSAAGEAPETILLLEHPDVITYGRSAKDGNTLAVRHRSATARLRRVPREPRRRRDLARSRAARRLSAARPRSATAPTCTATCARSRAR